MTGPTQMGFIGHEDKLREGRERHQIIPAAIYHSESVFNFE